MLSANKNNLEATLRNNLVELQHKEMKYFYANYAGMGTVSSILAVHSFACVSLSQSGFIGGIAAGSTTFDVMFYIMVSEPRLLAALRARLLPAQHLRAGACDTRARRQPEEGGRWDALLSDGDDLSLHVRCAAVLLSRDDGAPGERGGAGEWLSSSLVRSPASPPTLSQREK